MDHLEHPNASDWNNRRQWFESRFNFDERGGAYLLGEHALALLVELQAVFCAGAFVSSIILSCTIIDAHLREVELPENFNGGIQAAFDYQDKGSDELQWLRNRRNRLIHFKKVAAVSIDDQWLLREQHEEEAKRAIEITSAILFDDPWV
jgi:hypothetical protein